MTICFDIHQTLTLPARKNQTVFCIVLIRQLTAVNPLTNPINFKLATAKEILSTQADEVKIDLLRHKDAQIEYQRHSKA